MASQTEPKSIPTVMVTDSLGNGEPNDAELTISLGQPENVESNVEQAPGEKTPDSGETLVMTCEEGAPVALTTDLVSSDQVILIQGDETIMETGTADLQDLHIIVEVNGQQILLRNVVNGQPVLQELQIEEAEADKPADAGVKEVKEAVPSEPHVSEDTPAAPVLFQVRAEDGSFHNVNMDIERQQPAPNTEQDDPHGSSSKGDSSTLGAAVSEERPFQCDLCSATFARLGNYTRHRMIHTIHMKEDYRYKCEVCGRMFLQRCDLKRHALIHEGNLPYKCDYCGKGYVRKSDLVVHVRFHNNERSFPCTQCSKAFFQSGDLQRHIRQVHQRIKPLTCGHCQRKYSKEATLIRHMQTVHRDIILTSLSSKVQPMDDSEKKGQEVVTTPPSGQLSTT